MEKTETRMMLTYLVWATGWYDWTIFWDRKRESRVYFGACVLRCLWDTHLSSLSFLFCLYCYPSFIKLFIRVGQGRRNIKMTDSDMKLLGLMRSIIKIIWRISMLMKMRATVILKLWLQRLFKFLCSVFVSTSLGIPIVNLFTDNLNLLSRLPSSFFF